MSDEILHVHNYLHIKTKAAELKANRLKKRRDSINKARLLTFKTYLANLDRDIIDNFQINLTNKYRITEPALYLILNHLYKIKIDNATKTLVREYFHQYNYKRRQQFHSKVGYLRFFSGIFYKNYRSIPGIRYFKTKSGIVYLRSKIEADSLHMDKTTVKCTNCGHLIDV